LDGGAGDNVLIGGGGHDTLRNGHATFSAQAAVAATSAAPAATGMSINSNSVRLLQASVPLDNHSRQLDLNRIELNCALLARFFQQAAHKHVPHSRATLLEAKKFTAGMDDELLGALMSGFLSNDDRSITETMDFAFATYDSHMM
jgi:hypothetical protein